MLIKKRIYFVQISVICGYRENNPKKDPIYAWVNVLETFDYQYASMRYNLLKEVEQFNSFKVRMRYVYRDIVK